MNFNKYLAKATTLKEAHIRIPAKALKSTLGYADRLLGVSKRDLASQVKASDRIVKQDPFLKNRPAFKAINKKYEQARSASTSTRVKTGVGVTAAAIAHRIRNSDNQEEQYDLSKYQY